jgi:predicted tellurium resistance membrane protein TerC
MIEFLSDPHVWASLLTLTALEIVLGIDNLIFLSIVSGRLPEHQQRRARQIGLALALLGYLYFAIAFSAGVEGLNLWAAAARKRRALERQRLAAVQREVPTSSDS